MSHPLIPEPSCPLENELRLLHARIIISCLRAETMDRQRAKDSTLGFIALLPISEIEDAITKVDYHITQYPEFLPMRQFILGKKEEEESAHIVAQMQEHIRNNDIDTALSVAEKFVK